MVSVLSGMHVGLHMLFAVYALITSNLLCRTKLRSVLPML